MKFVLLCNDRFMTSELETILRNVPDGSEVMRVTGEFLVEGNPLPECDAVLAEAKTWQRSFAFFRYLGMLDILERVPLGAISGSGTTLKGRLGKDAHQVNVPITREDFASLVESFATGGDKAELMRASITF